MESNTQSGNLLQQLIEENTKYNELKWLSLDCFKKFWQYLSAQRSAVLAPEIVNSVIDVKGNLGVNGDEFAKLLVSAKVNMPYLITQMEVKEVSFHGEDSYKLLIKLEENYINQAGISNAEQDSRITHIPGIPIEFSLNNESIKEYIKNPQSSLLVISALLKNFNGNEADLNVIVELIKANGKTAHAAQLAILASDRLQNYKNLYYRPHFDKPSGINQFNPRLNKREILPKTHVEGIEKINGWINNLQYNQVSIKLHRPFLQFVQETTPWFAWMRGYQPLEQRLLNALNNNGLVGSGYEKSIVEYVIGAPADKKNQAIHYAISVVCKQIYQNTEKSIAAVKDSFREALEVQKVGLTDDQKERIATEVKKLKTVGETIEALKRLTASIPASVQEAQYKRQLLLKDIVKDIESNSRLKRIFQGAMMKKLKDKEKAAAGILLGKDSVQNMARVVVSDIDSELLGQITHLMSSTMTDIEAKYNLEPGYLSKISRGYNKVVAYPVWLFFEVLDFFAMLLEYAVEYPTRGLYWAYEKARGIPDDNKRVNKTILHKSDIETFIAGVTEITKTPKTPAEILRNEIIKYVAGDDNGDAVYKAIFAVLLDKHSSKQLKNALRKIKCHNSKYDKKALSALLEHLEVKLTPAEILKNEIIKYLTNGKNLDELRKALFAVFCDDNSSQKLQKEVEQISDNNEFTREKLSALLNNYEMKGVGSYTELTKLQTQAIDTIGLIG